MSVDRSLWQERSAKSSTSVEAIAAIEGVTKVTDFFGAWPGFDDAEVVAFNFDRGIRISARRRIERAQAR